MRTSVTFCATPSITVWMWNRWPATCDDRRDVVLVDERDARLRARIAGDEPDEDGDHDRVREERAEQERRAAQDPQVLAQQQPDREHAAGEAHPKASAAAAA